MPASWSLWAALTLDRACRGGSGQKGISNTRNQVVSGHAVLNEVHVDGVRRGAVVLRVDGSEGVIVAAACSAPGVRGVDLLPEVEKQFQRVHSIRFHTARRAWSRLAQRFGYKQVQVLEAGGAPEWVYRKTFLKVLL